MVGKILGMIFSSYLVWDDFGGDFLQLSCLG